MINPYQNVDWNNITKIPSISHCHVAWDSIYSQAEQQLFFDRVVAGGIRHFAISNYYPSDPDYPLSDRYQNIPADAIASPNAEQHGFARWGAMHLNSLGSFFSSGSPRDRIDNTWVPRQPVGVNGATWQSILPQIFADLQYADGGGVTINHPAWSNLTEDVILEMLDFDERVLGLEIYNQSSERQNQTGWAITLWDTVLSTGRKCWGFCTPDHDAEQGIIPWLGRNILLTTDVTEHGCLKAYRDGAFYSQLNNTNLCFSNIGIQDNLFTVMAENADTVTVIIDGESTVFQGNSASVSVPPGSVYVRAEAQSTDDRIFSNAITLREYSGEEHHLHISTKMMLLY